MNQRLAAVFASVLLFLAAVAAAQDPIEPSGEIPREVLRLKNEGRTFESHALFSRAYDAEAAPSEVPAKNLDDLVNLVEGATLAHLDAKALRALRERPPETLALELPYTQALDGVVELELVESRVFAHGFRVTTSSGDDEKLDLGTHYRGMVRGEPGSLVALSFVDGEVMGFVSSQVLGTLVVGRLATDEVNSVDSLEPVHVVYAEEDLKIESSFACGVGAEQNAAGRSLDKARQEARNVAEQRALEVGEKALSDCVKVYIEADYDIYQQRGSTSNVTSFLGGLFNQVATLYANENINTEISEIFVWTSPSPYSGSVGSSMLNQFGNTRTSFNGDLAHLVNFKGGGGIAWVDTLCAQTRYRQAVSGLNNGYSTVPTYSWSVEVFTHEMGHNLGSPHTQRCAWNGNNTAIDGCYPVEPANACPRPGLPSGGGTIMSYCHLTSAGINFNNGFGSQPGSLIRNRVSGASCLSACDGGGGGGCAGDTYTGSLSGSGDYEWEPNGNYYYSGSSGTHRGILSGPGGADFDLELYRWTGSWTKVAEGISSNSSEDVSYNGPSGYYVWRVISYSGSGGFSLCLTRP